MIVLNKSKTRKTLKISGTLVYFPSGHSTHQPDARTMRYINSHPDLSIVEEVASEEKPIEVPVLEEVMEDGPQIDGPPIITETSEEIQEDGQNKTSGKKKKKKKRNH